VVKVSDLPHPSNDGRHAVQQDSQRHLDPFEPDVLQDEM
jgi:hypothetical protein